MERLFADLVLSRPGGTGRRAGFALPVSLAVHAAAVTLLVLVSLITRDPLPRVDPPPGLMLPYVDVRPQGARAAQPPPARGPRPPRPAPPSVMSVARERPPAPVRDDVIDTPEGPPDTIVELPCLAPCAPGGVPDGVPGGDPAVVGPGTGVPPLAPVAPVRPGGEIRPPVKVRHVSPAYPEIARIARVQGDVVLDCTIDTQGRVVDVRVLSGPVLLQSSAADAVRQWLYRPTLLNGVAVPLVMTVTVRFRLEGSSR